MSDYIKPILIRPINSIPMKKSNPLKKTKTIS